MMMSKHKVDDSDINAAERENLILSMAKTMKPSLPQPAKEKPRSLIETQRTHLSSNSADTSEEPINEIVKTESSYETSPKKSENHSFAT